VITLTSAKGSPGVTTLGVAMACASGGVLVEVDPAGGDVALRAGISQAPGLIELAVRARREHGREIALNYCAQRLGSGATVVPAPVAVPALSSLLADAGSLTGIVSVLRSSRACPQVMADVGRFGSHVTSLLNVPGSACVVVARCDAASLGHARDLLPEIGQRRIVGLVLVEHGEFSATEAAAELGIRLLGVIPWHPRHAARLTDSAGVQTPRANKLVRAAASIVGAASALAGVDTQAASAGQGAVLASVRGQEVSA